jgi:hypothetical protein
MGKIRKIMMLLENSPAPFQVLTACWRRLPLQVAGALGGCFYKHLG